MSASALSWGVVTLLSIRVSQVGLPAVKSIENSSHRMIGSSHTPFLTRSFTRNSFYARNLSIEPGGITLRFGAL